MRPAPTDDRAPRSAARAGRPEPRVPAAVGAGEARLPFAGGLALLAVLGVLGVFVMGGLGHEDRRLIEREFLSGHYRLTPAWLARGARGYLTNDDDIYHFHAYARATLGQAYLPFYIRTRAAWLAKFARGVHEDPDLAPPVTAAAPLRPYRDFLVEYPPGAFLAFLPPALVSSSADGYTRAFKLQMAAFLLLVLAAAWRLAPLLGYDAEARRRLPGALAAAILALGAVSTHRFDAMAAASMLGAVLAAASGWPGLAGLALAVGITVKGVPGLMVPLLAAYLLFRPSRGAVAAARLLALGGGVAAATLAAAWIWCGPALWDGFAYQRDRPVQIESSAGALLSLANALRPGAVTVVHSFGSRNLSGALVDTVGAIVPVVSALATAAAMALVVGRLWRLRRAQADAGRLMVVVEGAVLVIAVELATGKVFCPQYLMWLLPFGLLAALGPGRSARWRWTGLGILAATQIIYPIAYAAVKALAPWASALVLARNAGLLAWTALLVRRRAATVSSPSASSGRSPSAATVIRSDPTAAAPAAAARS